MGNSTVQAQQEKERSNNNWLKRLKDESWEAELLVSAIAIFGTFKLFGFIDWVTNKFINVLSPNQYLIGYGIVFFGLFAISILVSMFVIHFFLRAYWIGLVGLNSVFDDYSIEDSAYSKIYTEKLISFLPKLKTTIHKVDELCSVIFSAAFTFLLMYSFMAISTSVYLLVYNLLIDFVPSYILLIPVVLSTALFVVQTVLSVMANLKKNKEKERLQIWAFKGSKLFSMISYGPLYKYNMQVMMIFGSNFKKKKALVYLMFVFVLSGSMVAAWKAFDSNILHLIQYGGQLKRDVLVSDATRIESYFYESQNSENTFLLNPELESEKIESTTAKLFIPIFDHEKGLRKQTCTPYEDKEHLSRNENRLKARLSYLNCYNTYHKIYLNEAEIHVDFLKYDHPRTSQFGIFSYIELEGVKRGLNHLKIVKKLDKESNHKIWVLPFYYYPKTNI